MNIWGHLEKLLRLLCKSLICQSSQRGHEETFAYLYYFGLDTHEALTVMSLSHLRSTYQPLALGGLFCSCWFGKHPELVRHLKIVPSMHEVYRMSIALVCYLLVRYLFFSYICTFILAKCNSKWVICYAKDFILIQTL